MNKFFFMVICVLVSQSAIAEKMYKCTQADGTPSFQMLPCKPSQQGEQITVKPVPSSGGQSIDYSYQSQPEPSDASKKIKKIVDHYNREQKKIWDDYYREKCERYTRYHNEAIEAWKVKKRQGYKQWERQMMEDEIKETQGDMNRECSER